MAHLVVINPQMHKLHPTVRSQTLFPSYSVNSSKGRAISGILLGSIARVMKCDTRSSDYGSYV